MFQKSDLDAIKKKIDIVEYLEQRGVALRQTGTNYTGLCPVHNERSPSFHVRPDSQTYRCFGCGISGDLISLVQNLDSLSFMGAVQELAQHAGLELKLEEDPEYQRRQRQYGILRLANQWFRRNYLQLEQNHPAKENLAQRNLYEYSLKDDTIGYAPRTGLIQLMTERGITIDELIEVGLVKLNNEGQPVDLFRNRIIWTVTDVQGRPIGYSARKLYEEDLGPKYINSPQTTLYNKSKTLLGLADAKKTILAEQKVYVVEGQTDVMAMKAAGFQNTVASCGTAFGTEHATMLLHLSSLGKDNSKFQIIFCFDGDLAGTKAAKSVFEKNPHIQLNSSVIQFLENNGTPTDPCDYRKTYGDQGLQQLLQNQKASIVEFVLTQELKNWDISTPEGQSGYLTIARQLLQHVTDQVQYSAYTRKLATWTGIPLSEISTMFRAPKPVQQKEETPTPVLLEEETGISTDEEKVLATLAQQPVEAGTVLNKLGINASYFKSTPDLVRTLLDYVNNQTQEIDHADKRIVKLLHVDTGLVTGRYLEGVEQIIRTFLRYRYSQDINQLNRMNLDFTELLFKQEEVRKYYKQ